MVFMSNSCVPVGLSESGPLSRADTQAITGPQRPPAPLGRQPEVYDGVDFLKNSYKIHPIARRLGWAMGCIMCAETLIDI